MNVTGALGLSRSDEVEGKNKTEYTESRSQ